MVSYSNPQIVIKFIGDNKLWNLIQSTKTVNPITSSSQSTAKDDKKNIVLDVLNNGCQSGFVGHLIYYSQTTAYYEEYKEEINELLYDTMDECGIYVPSELFGDKWDKEDPLALYQYNQNLLAWFGFEETMRNFAREFEEFEELI